MFFQCAKRFLNVRNQLLFIRKIVARAHIAEHFSVDDHLRADIVGRLQQDRIHAYHRCNPGSLRLHDLCASHLQALARNIGI